MIIKELFRVVVTPASLRWRQRPVAPVLRRRDAGAGEYDVWKRFAVDRSLVDCYHLRIWDLKIRGFYQSFDNNFINKKLLFADVLLNYIVSISSHISQ